jgi:hypothetical protein
VNTDTPIDTSFANSDTLQMSSPYGHDSSCNNYISFYLSDHLTVLWAL